MLMATDFQVVEHQVPTLGDLCDVQLAEQQQDPFAAARLLARWLLPAPTSEQLRALPVPDVGELMMRIVAYVRENSNALSLVHGTTLKLQ
jgi:hypothetical protein